MIIQLPPAATAAALEIGGDTLANPSAGETSAHSIAFTTKSDLVSGNTIELRFPDFSFDLASASDIIVPVGPTADISYSNANKKITLALTEDFSAGSVELAIADGGITNPAVEGQYSVRITTRNSNSTVLDYGMATALVDNDIQVLVNIIPVVLNVTSSTGDGSYWVGKTISIEVEFTGNVYVTGTPTLALNNGGTATYTSGSGTDTLTFDYEIQGEENTEGAELDYASTTALSLADGTIGLANGKAANLTLPEPGAEGSLGYNKDIGIQPFFFSVSAPTASYFEIIDEDGVTSDSTPIMQLGAINEAEKLALSCDAGVNWTDWITYPTDSELNSGNDADYSILSCSTDEGLKTISIKFSNSFGYESDVLTDSTIYEEPVHAAALETTEEPTLLETTTIAETKVITQTVDLSAAIEEVNTAAETTLDLQDSEEAEDTKIIEVGYVDTTQNVWKSIRDVTVDASGTTGTVNVDESVKNNLEVRVIEAKKLEKQITELKTSKAVLPKTGGQIPVEVELVSDKTSAKVKISAATNVSSGAGGGGGSYEYVIYAPEVVEAPPPTADNNLELEDAVFVGSSSGSISFDKPVLLTLPINNKKNPQIRHFDEAQNEWITTVDAKSGKAGGEIDSDGDTISVWVDHMTLFAVVGIKEVKLVGIKKIAVGSGIERRAEFVSGEWFSPADIGNDDLISFAWSGIGEKFYYTLDKNPAASSLRKITEDTKFTTDFFLDDIRVSEGESYLHLRAEGANGERDGETVFVVNYDKTPPRLAKIKNSEDKSKLELHFSEVITSNDVLLIYFADGRMLEIPALDVPTAEIEIAYEDEVPEIISIIGLLIDRAGLILVNPEADLSEVSDGNVHEAGITVMYPAQLSEGKYITKKAFVNVKPYATGAVKMRLADGEWEDYAEKEFRIPTEEFGTQKIIFEFEGVSGQRKSAGIVVSRLPANSSELIELIEAENSSFKELRDTIAQRLKGLSVWGVSTRDAEALEKANPAILPLDKIPTDVEIDKLNDALEIAQEIRELVSREKFSAVKLEKLASELAIKNFSLDDFLTIAEVSTLLAKTPTEAVSRLREFLDLNSIALQKSGDTYRIGELSLGMRDSDNDGIVDCLEIDLGSNPFVADSDGDGNSDGDEFLKLGSDPTIEDVPTATGFSRLNTKVTSPQPFLTGIATANSKIQIVAVSPDDAEITLGEATTDSRGNFQILSQTALPAGIYRFEIREGVNILATRKVQIDLDFVLTPPKVFLGESNIFEDGKPAFFGNTFYDGRVIAFFDGLAVAVCVDNVLGDFVVRPASELPIGKHKLIIFTELVDGTRSPARIIEFETVDPPPKQAAPEEVESLNAQQIALVGGILLAAGILGIWIFRRRRQTSP